MQSLWEQDTHMHNACVQIGDPSELMYTYIACRYRLGVVFSNAVNTAGSEHLFCLHCRLCLCTQIHASRDDVPEGPSPSVRTYSIQVLLGKDDVRMLVCNSYTHRLSCAYDTHSHGTSSYTHCPLCAHDTHSYTHCPCLFCMFVCNSYTHCSLCAYDTHSYITSSCTYCPWCAHDTHSYSTSSCTYCHLCGYHTHTKAVHCFPRGCHRQPL